MAATLENKTVLLIPGWHGSGPDHWQQHWWRSLPNSALLHQQDWENPDLQDWVEQLEAAIAALGQRQELLLVAHSLGCITVAHWAAQSSQRHLARIAGALLVAPADVERERVPAALARFAPIPDQTLPFPSILVGSENDTAASLPRAATLARVWGSDFINAGRVGHINVGSGHHRWNEGKALLRALADPGVTPTLHPNAAPAFAPHQDGQAAARP